VVNITESFVNQIMLEILRDCVSDPIAAQSIITNDPVAYVNLLLNRGYVLEDAQKITTVLFQNKFNVTIYSYLHQPSKTLTLQQEQGYLG